MSASRTCSRSNSRRAWFTALTGLAFVVAAIAACAGEVRSQTFRVAHRSVDDAYQLIAPALTARAEIRVLRAESVIVVSDEADTLIRIATLLAGFDVPRHKVRLTVRVVRGERRDGAEAELAVARAAGIPPNVGKLLRYNSYEPLGAADIVVDEAGSGRADIGERGDFRVEVRVGAVNQGAGSIELGRLTLARRLHSGSERDPSFQTLISWTEALQHGHSRVLFATPGVSDRRALFVIVHAEVLE